MADGDLIAVERAGHTLRFRPCGGRVESFLRKNRLYEQSMLEYIEALAAPGVYADIGAYVGTHALFFAAFCPASRVLAFEPRPHILEHLRDNVAASQLGDRVEIHGIALSDRDETVSVRLDHQRVSFDCTRLDDLIHEPVSVMKLDVEGMEEKVLAGAAGVLARSRPLLFVEAQDRSALDRILRAIEPHGYRATGRAFNETATYELAADPTPVPLPAVTTLLEPRYWTPDDPALSVAVEGRMRIESSLRDAEHRARVTAEPAKLMRPPREAVFTPAKGAVQFLQAVGEAAPGMSVWIYLLEYRGGARTHVQRHRFTPRLFQRVELQPDTEMVRIAIRLAGPGVLELERLAIHTLER